MASYLQSYFQNSSMPKRLIQYALSRLDILDTEALGLDNLDIAWGKNTTLEFRDVGLRLKKLEALISLPPSFELIKAKVLLLRLTIPVDVYSSPIVIEIDGIEGQLRIKAKKDTGRPARRTDHDRIRKQPTSSRTKPHKGRRWSDFVGNEDDESVLPTANDLAASFLQAEPDEERAELEAALLSETQDLGTSSVLSEDGDIPVGTGAALSLPSFMAKFLQGIGDRLQIRVRGIVFNLDIDMPNENPRPSGNSTDLVTVQFTVDNVDIEGVTQKLDTSDESDNGRSKLQLKEGKRLIRLSKLRGALITEANLFSTLARSSAMSSPSTTQSDAFGERRATFNSSSSKDSEIRAYDDASSSHLESSLSSTRLSLASSHQRTKDSGIIGASIIASDSGRFEDAPEDEDASNLRRSLQESHGDIGDSILEDSQYLDKTMESQYLEHENSPGESMTENQQTQQKISPRLPSPLSTPRGSLHIQTESGDIDSSPDNSDEESLSNSLLESRTPALQSRQRFSTARLSQSQISLDLEPILTHSNDVADKSSSQQEEDLTQSQLFSHEDAESMYMSAISHKSPTKKIPGGWDAQSSGSEGTVSPPGSPITAKSVGESLDNLEHALHAPLVAQSEDIKTVLSTSTPSVNQNVIPKQMSESPKIAQTEPKLPQTSSNVSENSTTSSDEYTRLTKQFFDLDQINIYIPGILSNLSPESPESIEASVASSMFSGSFDGHGDSMPGAFSSYTPQKDILQPAPARNPQPPATEPPKEAGDLLSAVEIVIGSLLLQFDISIGRLAFRLAQVLLEAMRPDTPVTPTAKSSQDSRDARLIFDANDISIKFLERLEGTLGSAGLASDARPLRADVLLQTTLTGLHVDAQQLSSMIKTSVALKKFVFGYAHENIVSFNASMQMGASVKDLKASDGIDMSATITSSDEATRCQIITLPMHVSIDLQRLDETFSWFGGLSSVLNMGSSIASNATITASPSKQKPRGVRFETPIRPDDKSLVAQNKADVRIGGIILDLIGTECSIGVSTSAAKIVNRDEGIGVFIQKIRLSGPHLNRSNEDPAISIDVTATRVEFLPAPKDIDLDRLLSLITPSKAKYDQDDDILLETLLRQRKQGSVLRLTVDNLQAQVGRLHELSYLPELGEEVSRLASVAKYLPDDDRPGLLSLVMVKKFGASVDFNNNLGIIQLSSTDIEVAQITLPALVALSVGSVAARRNGSEELLGAATDPELRETRARSPAIMARMIGDEMEPVVKIKLWNLKVEYRVPTLMTLMGLGDNATAQDLSTSITASVATLTDFARSKTPKRSSDISANATSPSKAMAFDVILRDCIIGLNPLGLPSKVLIVLTEAHLEATLPKDQNAHASMDMSKASVLVIDNVAHITSASSNNRPRRYSFDGGSTQVSDLCATGYVSVSYISSAKAIIHLTTSDEEERSIDVELRDDLFVLESCADSTQTLIAVLNGLAPPTPPSTELKFRTKVIPVKDLLASLSGDAFGTAEGDYSFDDDFGIGGSEGEFPETEEDDLDFDSHFYQETGEDEYDMEDESGSVASSRLTSRDTNDGVLLESLAGPQEAQEHMELDFNEDHFGSGSILEGTAHRWNSAKNTYDRSNAPKIKKSPLKVCVRDVHIIWNLFDGYDWQHTRDTITKAVQDVESKAIEKRARNDRRPTFEQDFEEEETVIGDFLFNSIYIGIPANRDPRELSAAINQELNDNATETESIATTSLSSSPSRPGGSHRPKSKRLRLNRSKHHKITFELRGVCVDLVAFPPGSGETQSSVDIRVHDFEIFDHVPTSTWRKFATYMQDAGERETGASMIHIEILNVKPIPELAASEIVLKATVLPLRLHVDQDALDFITRFFEFKDDSAPTPGPPGDVPFIQRAEVNSVVVKLDFKPKRVDYAGLRSGHTTEFMNFLILDEADMVLRHTIIYGVSGFDKLGKCLNDIWMPDVKRNQLPGILAGLAPVRSLVNVGGGFRHLVVVPMREYKKDGRIVRSISKGAAAFAKTTGTELVKLGAKVAIGVQTVLQGAEGFLGPSTEEMSMGADDDDAEEDSKQISLYANQPVGVMQGLRGGYAGLQRDLLLARDAIIAVPGEVMEGGNAAGVLRAVRKHAPTVILRPAIGVAKAGGQILMGATNSLDPVNLQRADAKYKKY